MAAISYSSYMTALQGDFVDFVVSESEAFRKIGTSSKTARIRLIKLVFLMGAYSVMLEFNGGVDTNMFTNDEMDVYAEIINDILGTSYEIDWGSDADGIWRDGDNAGIWDDDAYSGVFNDIQ